MSRSRLRSLHPCRETAVRQVQPETNAIDSSYPSRPPAVGRIFLAQADRSCDSFAATVAASAAFVVFGTKSLNALDELGKLSSKLGVSTKFLSEYAAVADKAGLSQTQFSTGVQRFLRRLGEAQQGTGELLKPLKALGIGLKDNNGNFREGTEVFQEYIKSLGEMENAQQALAFATKATPSHAFSVFKTKPPICAAYSGVSVIIAFSTCTNDALFESLKLYK